MIAKNIPQRSQLTKSVKANAALYGLTESEYREACRDWLENEGYDGYGNAYEDVYEWLTIDHARHASRDAFDGGRGAGQLNQNVD